MKIISDIRLAEFNAWQGAADTLKDLSLDQIDALEIALETIYPDGISARKLNDFLWFGRDEVAEWLGFSDYDDLLFRNSTTTA